MVDYDADVCIHLPLKPISKDALLIIHHLPQLLVFFPERSLNVNEAYDMELKKYFHICEYFHSVSVDMSELIPPN